MGILDTSTETSKQSDIDEILGFLAALEKVRNSDQNKGYNNAQKLESISSTFLKRICANILAPIKSLTFTASTKKLCAKLLYKKVARKMLVKLTPNVVCVVALTEL
jgi:hypothetical protein